VELGGSARGGCVISGTDEAGSPPDDVPFVRTAGPWLHRSGQYRGAGRCPFRTGAWG